ncbi:uncharacterized protein SPSK_01320 [Sporothrix schenckii 1099-18]|uniref:Uncharacterized protein n=1 Tax=Sporothrix schenckii 1099-18 TaxID=1397361 RepID=A0A0F2LX23_SPOSC|nr:uncharacterized protein SPSK_01320 [Sporothrix schenckii 1099-18]KJR81409.1 hypothetical protein SPSK_01320 [Sporothrix schenckii 1099-18]
MAALHAPPRMVPRVSRLLILARFVHATMYFSFVGEINVVASDTPRNGLTRYLGSDAARPQIKDEILQLDAG